MPAPTLANSAFRAASAAAWSPHGSHPKWRTKTSTCALPRRSSRQALPLVRRDLPGPRRREAGLATQTSKDGAGSPARSGRTSAGAEEDDDDDEADPARTSSSSVARMPAHCSSARSRREKASRALSAAARPGTFPGASRDATADARAWASASSKERGPAGEDDEGEEGVVVPAPCPPWPRPKPSSRRMPALDAIRLPNCFA
jgi:hypothetical protein